jgi:hypothetical protein
VTEPGEPAWIDGVSLEILARACATELGAPVHLPVVLRQLGSTWSDRRRSVRRGGYRRFERAAVPVRDDAAVAAILDGPRTAWRAGDRSPAALGRTLYDAIAGSSRIGGARGVLATCAVLLFLSRNGWLMDGRPGWFVQQLRSLVRGGVSDTAARAVANLARPRQR